MYPHLPLTPPEYQQYPSHGMQLNQHQYATGNPPPEKGVYEINIDPYARKHMPPSFVPVHQGYHRQQQKYYSGLPPPGITHPGGHFSQHRHAGPQRRVEAPLSSETGYSHRSSGHSSVSNSSAHSRQDSRRVEAAPAPVEEKATGGVSAHLDYDMEEMTDFVAIMAQRLVTMSVESDNISAQYRKFVFQILSSTRLPSSTILLGLVYLRERMGLPNMQALKADHVYRYLTIALLLASKFLDDNTFQNKSWSEVTSIQVIELNALEKDWLREIKWNLHVDAEGNKGFSQYKNMWETWKQQVASKVAHPPLAPIDHNNGRPRSHISYSPPSVVYPAHQTYAHSSAHSSMASERPVHLPPVQQQAPWWNGAEYSPPSAPETGPATPEEMFRWSAAPPYHMQMGNYSRLPPIVPPANHPSWQTHNHYAPPPHGPLGACGCGSCRHMESSFLVPNYGPPITA